MKIYAVVRELYFDTYAGDETVNIPIAYYATRELAEKVSKNIIEIKVEEEVEKAITESKETISGIIAEYKEMLSESRSEIIKELEDKIKYYEFLLGVRDKEIKRLEKERGYIMEVLCRTEKAFKDL